MHTATATHAITDAEADELASELNALMWGLLRDTAWRGWQVDLVFPEDHRANEHDADDALVSELQRHLFRWELCWHTLESKRLTMIGKADSPQMMMALPTGWVVRVYVNLNVKAAPGGQVLLEVGPSLAGTTLARTGSMLVRPGNPATRERLVDFALQQVAS